MDSIEKGYNLFVQGRMKGVLDVTILAVPEVTFQVDEGKVSVLQTRPPQVLSAATISSDRALIRLLREEEFGRDQEQGGYICLDVYVTDLDLLAANLRTVLIDFMADVKDQEVADQKVQRILEGMLTEVKAQEAYYAVQTQAATAANN